MCRGILGDVTWPVFLNDINSYLQLCWLLEDFYKYSGLRINNDKTEIFAIGSFKHAQSDFIHDVRTSIKILGTCFDYHKPSRNKANFESIFKSIQRTVNMQSRRMPVLEEAMKSRFYCFARKSQNISARKYGLSKKLDSRFHRSICENCEASLSNIPWARVKNLWQSESKSLSFWKGLRRSRRNFDRHRM